MKKILLFLFIVVSLFYNRAFCGIVYVDSSHVGGTQNGSSWSTAISRLQIGINTAGIGDTVLVAKGTYYPNGLQSDVNRDKAFTLLHGGLKVYGGYPSGGGVRNISAYPTILDGDIGIPNDTSDNSYHIVIIAGLGVAADSVILDGVTIRNGNARGSAHFIFNAQFVSRESGGGIVTYNNDNAAGAKVAIRNCTLTKNYCSNNGGAMYNYLSATEISDCTFDHNYSDFNGGGVYNEECSPRITNSLFVENSASVLTGAGGALHNAFDANAFISRCTFIGNAARYGGAMRNAVSTSTVVNCRFSGNYAALYGGGMYNNTQSPVIVNCTFSGNNAVSGGGIYNSSQSSPQIKNCILYGNSSSVEGSGPVVTYSLIEQTTGVYPGTGNINTDPMFLSAPGYSLAPFTSGNYHLSNASPCINTGINSAIPAGITTDLDGNFRIMENVVDMGAFEHGLGAPLSLYNILFSGSPLPDGRAWLTWKVAGDKRMASFEVQRSDDGIAFSTIAVVAAKEGKDEVYSFTDEHPGDLAFYRLLIYDSDHFSTYSEIVKVIQAGKPDLYSIYPNPSKDKVNIVSRNWQAANYATLYDATGRKVKAIALAHPIEVMELSGLDAGFYLLKINNGVVFKLLKE